MAVTYNVNTYFCTLCNFLFVILVCNVKATFTEDPIRRSSCVTSGGQCETLFQCMFSMGISAGSCGGFLSVCCVKPVTINRWLHDNRINDGFNEDYKAQRDRHREPGHQRPQVWGEALG